MLPNFCTELSHALIASGNKVLIDLFKNIVYVMIPRQFIVNIKT